MTLFGPWYSGFLSRHFTQYIVLFSLRSELYELYDTRWIRVARWQHDVRTNITLLFFDNLWSVIDLGEWLVQRGDQNWLVTHFSAPKAPKILKSDPFIGKNVLFLNILCTRRKFFAKNILNMPKTPFLGISKSASGHSPLKLIPAYDVRQQCSVLKSWNYKISRHN